MNNGLNLVTVRLVKVSLTFTNKFAFEMNPLVVKEPVMIALFIVES